jgi:hypothetical protein
MFERIILSTFLFAIWYAILKYRKVVHGWTWNWLWAEKYLGRWWTYTALVLFGLGFIMVAIMHLFWQFEFNNNLEWIWKSNPMQSQKQ